MFYLAAKIDSSKTDYSVLDNIKGNRYRLIVGIDYKKQIIFIKYVLTHAEYDKEAWKNDPYY